MQTNLVFATTNSAAVENLLEERSFFDWTIIEEPERLREANSYLHFCCRIGV